MFMKKYPKLPGLEGPKFFPNGQVLYFDPKEDAWYDPSTDFYLSDEEANTVLSSVFEMMAK